MTQEYGEVSTAAAVTVSPNLHVALRGAGLRTVGAGEEPENGVRQMTEVADRGEALRPRSAGAQRMARHRRRRRNGMRCLTIELRKTEIDQLIRRKLLACNSRDDLGAIRRALYDFLEDTLW
jgi:hypothetical protein